MYDLGVATHKSIGRGRIELALGNIVDVEAHAIVNAANRMLQGGGGVDGAIHRAAGPSILEECHSFTMDETGERCPTGEVRVTAAGNLKAKWIIHAVGPVYDVKRVEECEKDLERVHWKALEAAHLRGCLSIAFPAISTGAYRFPVDSAARIAMDVMSDFLQNQVSEVNDIRFVLFSEEHLRTFENALATR